MCFAVRPERLYNAGLPPIPLGTHDDLALQKQHDASFTLLPKQFGAGGRRENGRVSGAFCCAIGADRS